MSDEYSNISFNIYRRHSRRCARRARGRIAFGCDCPIYGDGYLDGQRILRKSLRTRDAAKANARMARLVQACREVITEQSDSRHSSQSNAVTVTPPTPPAPGVPPKTPSASDISGVSVLRNAVNAFLENCETNGVGPSTLRKYRNSLNRLATFAESNGIEQVGDVTVVHLDSFRAARGIAPLTSLKELETLRGFWSYCVVRKLCSENVAALIKGPKIDSPNDVEPYAPEEIQRIVAATQQFGRYVYERTRALAIILLLRYTALRISDVAVLRRDRIIKENGRWLIFIRATKNKKRIYLPIPRELKDALDHVPSPRGAAPGCPYFFWSGQSLVKSIVSVVEECVTAVFRKSGVEKAHAHRFRHTLATEMLGEGATYEEVADVLGDSIGVVIKHYAKWSRRRQERITDLMSRVHADADWSPDEPGE